ncbi:hypothetical protein BD414DRAFT_524334 [Trametes punicea]|nr:hypothetical protein BD414DRAFT_524334 [Trametes punicea]
MVIPIYPNTPHPSGRSPIYTETPFPFPNCYHWVDSIERIRIRRKAEMYDDSHAVKVSAMQHVMIDMGFSDDYERMDDFERNRLERGSLRNAYVDARGHTSEPGRCSPVPVHLPPSSTTSQDSPLSQPSSYFPPYADTSSHPGDGGHPTPRPCPSPSNSLMCDPTVEAIIRMDVFNLAHDHAAEVLPLVDMWFELADHLTADTIPSPLDFHKERDAIARIVHDARSRSPNVPTPSRNEDRMSVISDDPSTGYNDDVFHLTQAAPLHQKCDGEPTPAATSSITTSTPLQMDVSNPFEETLESVTAARTAAPKIRSHSFVRMFRLHAVRRRVSIAFKTPPWSVRPPLLPYWS